MSASRSRNWSHDRDRDRFAARRRSFANWYANLYPGYAFNLLLDPGFYDWDQTDNFASDQGDAAYAPAPYTDYGSGAPGAVPEEGPQGEIPPASMQGVQRAAAESVASPALLSVQPLTVVFKDGRAPVQMQNYMMTATVLTDLDARHYAQIPVDQIDVAATRQANSAAGVGFAVPGASRD